jgi:transcriptional regulator with XRE-family HTH domain
MLEAPRSLDQLLVHLGQRIQALRRARRWSQQQLGDTAGLHRSYVNAVEQGRQNLTLGAVVKLAAALDEPLDGLLFPSNSGRSGELPS